MQNQIYLSISERECLRGANLNDTIKRAKKQQNFVFSEPEYLRDFYRNDTIKRVETKSVLSIPSVSIFAISIAKIRQWRGEVRNSEK